MTKNEVTTNAKTVAYVICIFEEFSYELQSVTDMAFFDLQQAKDYCKNNKPLMRKSYYDYEEIYINFNLS